MCSQSMPAVKRGGGRRPGDGRNYEPTQTEDRTRGCTDNFLLPPPSRRRRGRQTADWRLMGRADRLWPSTLVNKKKVEKTENRTASPKYDNHRITKGQSHSLVDRTAEWNSCSPAFVLIFHLSLSLTLSFDHSLSSSLPLQHTFPSICKRSIESQNTPRY